MRESFGTTFNLTLLFAFILLVTGFALFGINFYKAFSFKNKLITTIEQYEGNLTNENLKADVIENINRIGYHIAPNQMNSVNAANKNDGYICDLEQGWCYKVTQVNKSKDDCTWMYEIKTFVSTDIPLINRVLSGTKLFDVSGSTKIFKRRGAC